MRQRFLAALAACLALGGARASADVKTQEIEYKQGDTPLKGFLAYDDAVKGKRPGVVVVHEWWGHNQHARNQAIRLAQAGYVGFALDMYGNGKVEAPILIQTGGADPMVPKDKVEAFAKDLKDSGAKVEVITYPNAKHSFTNPDAAKAGMDGLAYDADAD